MNLAPRDGGAPEFASGLVRPIADLADPFDLEVHRAIEVEQAADTVLPSYVRRELDEDLADAAARAVAGESVIRVLVGGSSTGKTRACWEAIKSLPAGWRLWHPIDPGRPEAVLAGLRTIEPRTVIWLNETQHYLLPPASNLGERVAAGLRELLRRRDKAPVLILGTIWPQYWETLTRDRTPLEAADPHAQARSLLRGSDIPTPSSFSGSSLADMNAAARGDPRLRVAIARAEGGQITQFLAGVPELMGRYHNASPAARAVIQVAMDARRLGHELTIPRSLLAEAAPFYLTDQEWDLLADGWLETALAYCADPCLGTRGPLTQVRPRPGQVTPSEPMYRLADYLEQHGRAERAHTAVPGGLWRALEAHAAETNLIPLGAAAQDRGLFRDAYLLFARASRTNPAANQLAGRLLRRIGRIDEALDCFLRAAETGDSSALVVAGEFARDESRLDVLMDWLTRRGEHWDSSALRHVGFALRRIGMTEEALAWLRRVAETGGRWSVWEVAGVLRAEQRFEEALAFYRRAANAGAAGALREAADLLWQLGRPDEAEALYRDALGAGDGISWWRLARLLHETGRLDEAGACYSAMPGTRKGPGLAQAAHMYSVVGRVDTAVEYFDRSIAAGRTASALDAAKMLAEHGRFDDALRYACTALEAHLDGALPVGFELLYRNGRVEPAIDWIKQWSATATDTVRRDSAEHLIAIARELAQSGHPERILPILTSATEAADDAVVGTIFVKCAEILAAAGRAQDAFEWLAPWLERDSKQALHAAGYAAQALGRHDDAIDFWTRSGEKELAASLAAELGRVRWAEGRTTEALEYFKTAAYTNRQAVLESIGGLLIESGMTGEAEDFYGRALMHGHSFAIWSYEEMLLRIKGLDAALNFAKPRQERWPGYSRVVRLLVHSGRVDEAVDWALGLASAGTMLDTAKLLREIGRADRALDIFRALDDQGFVGGGGYGTARHVFLLLVESGRRDEAYGYIVQRLEAGGTLDHGASGLTVSGVAALLERAGFKTEAARLDQYGITAGAGVSAPWSP